MNAIWTKLVMFQAMVLCCHGQESGMTRLMSEYQDESRQARSQGQFGSRKGRLVFESRWLVKFNEALAASNGAELGKNWVAHEASLLSHQQGDHKAALRLADEAAKLFAAAGDHSFEALVVTNAAMIALDRHSADPTADNMRAALARFKEAKPRLQHLGKVRMSHGLEFLQKYGRMAEASGDNHAALDAYESGLELLAAEPVLARELSMRHGASFSREWFLYKKIVQSLILGRAAQQDLDALHSMKERAFEHSYYLNLIAREVWGADAAKRLKFLENESQRPSASGENVDAGRG
jgi:hypothetical protein